MPHRCPECGALLSNDVTCQSIFESFLALEFSDPAYSEAHFLTVSCYMVQHNRYSDEALAWIEPRLRDYLEKGIPARKIVKPMAMDSGQKQRQWKVVRQASVVVL
jgi:hypothetical protein